MKNNKYYRVYAEINLDAIVKNVDNLMALTKENTGALAVVKADGYGHGDVAVAKAVAQKVTGYAVATLDEAVNLRENGVKKPILVLGYVDPYEFDILVSHEITATVFDVETAQLLADAARVQKKQAHCHIKVDTGMSRIGFMCQEFPRDDYSVEEIRTACTLKNLELEGMFTHFCVSDEAEDGKDFTEKQYSCFSYVRDKLKESGINIKICHCSNSGAIEDYEHTYCDMVRAGIILYGLAPSYKIQNNLNLIPAMTLKSTVAYVKNLKKGADISYGRTFTAPKDMKIATVPIGYADGFIRQNAKDGYMLVNGKKAKIVGRICMDQTMIDVTDIEDVKIGDEVVIFGTGENGEMTADDLAKNTDTINYEVVCLVGKRVPRIYIKNGKVMDVMYKL